MVCSNCFTTWPVQRAILITTLVTINAAFVMGVVFHFVLQKGVWAHHTPAICDTWCENSHTCPHTMQERPPVQQLVNSWSNLGYLIVGVWPLALHPNFANLIFGMTCAYHFVASFVFHASIAAEWGKWDVAAMYTLLGVAILHGVHAILAVSWNWLAGLALGFGVAVPFLLETTLPIFAPTNFMILLICCVVVEMTILVMAKLYVILKTPTLQPAFQPSTPNLPEQPLSDDDKMSTAKVSPDDKMSTAKVSPNWFCVVKELAIALLPGLVFGLAYLIWNQDVNKEWCNPTSWLQGHAAWHVLTAMALLLIWNYFDTHCLCEILACSNNHDGTADATMENPQNDNQMNTDTDMEKVMSKQEAGLALNDTMETEVNEEVDA